MKYATALLVELTTRYCLGGFAVVYLTAGVSEEHETLEFPFLFHLTEEYDCVAFAANIFVSKISLFLIVFIIS